MKSILISIKPKYVADILNGRKTIEIRKTMPKCDFPIDVYIYCTKDNKQGLVWDNQGKGLVNSSLFPYGEDCPERYRLVNGKVVAKFILNNVDEWHNFSWHFGTCYGCISDEELRNYSKDVKSLYYWFIDNLVIFDKPKELSEFYKFGFSEALENSLKAKPFPISPYFFEKQYQLTKAPQSYIFIESEN